MIGPSTASRLSTKAKVSKIAEFWGAERPFANFGREQAAGDVEVGKTVGSKMMKLVQKTVKQKIKLNY